MSKVFGERYEIIERIGVGGMAIVYKAKDLLLNRIVTIKVLREQFASDDDFVRRFRREAQSAASLSHPNIVSIYDVGKDGDTEYIVMEYVEGQNLKELIRNYAPLSSEQSINLAMQIAQAIRHAHEHNIIHRDIKPHNILVTADGRLKVTDFGIARAVSAATMTHTGDIVGSVHYLSPEQAKGVQTNEQSDLYSLGIILYELLTGKVPYDGETPIAIALKHLQEQPVPPSKLNPRISQELESIILRAIAKSPEQRYKTAVEMLEDLSHVQNGQPIRKVDLPFEEDLESTRIHKSLSSGVNEALSSLPKNEDSGLKPSKKKRKIWPWVAAGVVLLLLGLGFGLRSYIGGGTAKVPNLVGKSVMDAGVFVKLANLQLDPNPEEEYSDTIEKGKITRQDPVADSNVKAGRSIKIWVSEGPQMLKMPNVSTGKMSLEDAKNAIKSTGFSEDNITIDQDPASALPSGTVISQDPAADAQWPKNGKIKLKVSGGSGTANQIMPNLVGYSVNQAQSVLVNQMKLTTVITKQKSEDYPEGAVISTNPKPGDPIQPGSVVNITVSSGPGPSA